MKYVIGSNHSTWRYRQHLMNGSVSISSLNVSGTFYTVLVPLMENTYPYKLEQTVARLIWVGNIHLSKNINRIYGCKGIADSGSTYMYFNGWYSFVKNMSFENTAVRAACQLEIYCGAVHNRVNSRVGIHCSRSHHSVHSGSLIPLQCV